MAALRCSRVIVLLSVACISFQAWGQTPAPPPTQAAPAQVSTTLRALLDQGKFAEALTQSEADLKAGASAGAAIAKVEALLGLGRTPEAAQAALRFSGQYRSEGTFRLLMGDCAFKMGNAPQAVRVWAALTSDANFGDAAYVRSVRALIATGDEAGAQRILSEAMASLSAPSVELCVLVVACDFTPADGIKAARALARQDASRKPDCDVLEQVYSAMGSGRVLQDVSTAGTRGDIALKEKSEAVDTSSLQWDASGDSKTMRMGSGTRVVLQVAMKDGKQRWMSLETGAGTVMLSPYAAEEMGLQVRSTRLCPGLGYLGNTPREWVILESLTAGPVTLKNVPAFVIGKKDAHFWKETTGVFPLKLLRNHAVLYDRRGGRLGISPPGTAPEEALGAGAVRLKSLWPGQRPFVAAKLQDRDNSFFLLDTGASPTWVSATFAPALGLRVTTTGDPNALDNLLSRGLAYPAADRGTAPLPAVPIPGGGSAVPDGKARATTSRSWGVNSVGTSGMMEVEASQPVGVAQGVRLVVGGAQFDMPKVAVADVGKGEGFDCYGILGRSVLDYFTLFFDYSKGVVAAKEYRKGK